MRKPAFCICENKHADQLFGNREVDQRLCFRYTYNPSTSYIRNFKSLALYSPVCVGPGRKPRRPVFSQRGSYVSYTFIDPVLHVPYEPCCENLSSGFPTRSDTNQAVQSQKMAGCLKFWV